MSKQNTAEIMDRITEKEVELVKGSWEKVIPSAAEAGMFFYHQLFTLSPEVCKLFHGDLRSQGSKLMNTSFSVVDA